MTIINDLLKASPKKWNDLEVSEKITLVTDAVAKLLISKNKAYGNSALNPVRIFSTADPIEQIKVRIDDKLSRLQRGKDLAMTDESRLDTIMDLLGYLPLLLIALADVEAQERHVEASKRFCIDPAGDDDMVDAIAFAFGNMTAKPVHAGQFVETDRPLKTKKIVPLNECESRSKIATAIMNEKIPHGYFWNKLIKMNRKQLKSYIKRWRLEINEIDSMSDADIRKAIYFYTK